jgi:hypothetical protein
VRALLVVGVLVLGFTVAHLRVVVLGVLVHGFDHLGGDRHAVRSVPDLITQDLCVSELAVNRRLGDRGCGECRAAERDARRNRQAAHRADTLDDSFFR